MNIFKKISKKAKVNKKKESESWYNNSHEKKRKLWNMPNDGDCYNGALFDMAQANNCARRK